MYTLKCKVQPAALCCKRMPSLLVQHQQLSLYLGLYAPLHRLPSTISLVHWPWQSQVRITSDSPWLLEEKRGDHISGLVQGFESPCLFYSSELYWDRFRIFLKGSAQLSYVITDRWRKKNLKASNEEETTVPNSNYNFMTIKINSLTLSHVLPQHQ